MADKVLFPCSPVIDAAVYIIRTGEGACADAGVQAVYRLFL